MAEFLNWFDSLMVDEGRKLTNDTGDNGGLSFCGISSKNYPNWEGFALLKELGIKIGETCEQVMPLVKKFYNNNYWLPLKGDMIDDQAYANKLGSDMVNMGSGTAIRLAQEALNIQQTGKVDDVTLKAINE